MRTHAAFQLMGGRTHQCDATATFTSHGARAYVLCDGIGSNDEVRGWTRAAARRLARAAATQADAEAGLRAQYNAYAKNAQRQDEYTSRTLPSACAVVVVTAPGKPLTVAWCGDVRAYILTKRGTVRCLTTDHNLRRVCHGNRNYVTSYLGAMQTDEQVQARFGHPAIEHTTRHLEDCRLLLASDGAYEPLEDSDRNLANYLTGTPSEAARRVATSAIAYAKGSADNATALVVDVTFARLD